MAPKAQAVAPRTHGVIAYGPYQAVIERTLQALHACGFRVTNVDPEAGVVKANAGASWKSLGEGIDVCLRSLPDNGIQVSIDSSLKFGWADWGKNAQNTKRFYQVLLLGSRS